MADPLFDVEKAIAKAPKEGTLAARAVDICNLVSNFLSDCSLPSSAKANNAKNVEDNIVRSATLDKDALLASLKTSLNGLMTEDAQERLKQHGPNVLSTKLARRWYKILWNAFWHPFNVILLVLATISGATSDIATVIVMCLMVVLSVGVRFYQEFKSSRAASKLSELVRDGAAVKRRENDSAQDGVEVEISQEVVVPGDIVILRTGDLLPGDIYLLTSNNLLVSQSALTGESIAVEKYADVIEDESTPLLDLKNVCFMGTSVESGGALGVVISTGDHTYISTIATSLARRAPINSFQKGVRRVSYLLICFMLAMVPIVIVISGFTTHNWGNSALFGISVAVGLTPEMLPMIVNANLARGALVMARKKCIVKTLDSVQNMGAMDILCTDKTGTLTIDRVAMVQYMDCHGISKDHVFEYAYLNSHFQTGLRNLIDSAILSFGDQVLLGGDRKIDPSKYKLVSELPFDFVRRRMSVILEMEDFGINDGRQSSQVEVDHNAISSIGSKPCLLVTKGALEEMLEICSSVQTDSEGRVAMTPEYRKKLLSMGEELNADGLRLVAVATKELKQRKHATVTNMSPPTVHDHFSKFSSEQHKYKHSEESDMLFHGILTFQDPPKESAKEAIETLERKGVAIKVLTGDALSIAVKICKDVGIATDFVVSGPELALLDSNEFVKAVHQATIMAKLTPNQKLKVVEALKVGSHTVGFLGDGINDSLALKSADVGISVDSATSVAKDAADIILLQKDLNVLVAGVTRGRITHGNTIKYIKMAASSNFGNVFSILVASAWLPFDPMKPIQILTQNLLYDFSQASIPWDKMDPEYLETPHQWSAKGIATFMICMGPISSIFDITTFNLMWFHYGIRTVERQAVFQTAWFLEGLLTQTLVIHMLRTKKIPFIQATASVPVLITTGIIVGLGLAIPYTPLGKTEKMVNPYGSYYYFLAITIFAYCCLAQLAKMAYIRVFKKWL
ncbi:hypothetical protein O6H91_05G071400 [Diphasiastrum complanatum]|uniref:Uncharacterized protein n=1 Tax=Diphasiastrum complanatum TaxID=34168 RepID=A0ACC2DPB6_DIPCM|nr:hypothetical protein O6H91_05G071400 [Diphasiastrum complanatum]